MAGNHYGFWGNGDTNSHLPRLSENIDIDWNPEDRGRLIEYISECPVVIAAATLVFCSICKKRLSSVAFQTDDCWLWPTNLKHYIVEHHVRLPDEFCHHIRSVAYKWPEEVFVPIDQLPWPE